MKLITRFELAAKSPRKLRALYREVAGRVTCLEPGRQERDNALASLENISRELACRAQL